LAAGLQSESTWVAVDMLSPPNYTAIWMIMKMLPSAAVFGLVAVPPIPGQLSFSHYSLNPRMKREILDRPHYADT
jgi:hypothetical protein